MAFGTHWCPLHKGFTVAYDSLSMTYQCTDWNCNYFKEGPEAPVVGKRAEQVIVPLVEKGQEGAKKK